MQRVTKALAGTIVCASLALLGPAGAQELNPANPAVKANPANPAAAGEAPPPAPKAAPAGLVAQLEELIDWLARTRDLVPRAKECDGPCFVLDQLVLTGSVGDNSLRFFVSGSVISDKPVLVPLFGPTHQVMLSEVTLGGKPAVVGFERDDFYFVRTGERFFTITGSLSLGQERSFTVPGPLNLFSATLTDGRVVEGNRIPGLTGTTIHLELGKKDEAAAASQPPVFHVARAVRIQKEISFEYRVTVKSGGEVSSVRLPLPHGEVVLDVPGHNGWKQEGGALTVPTSGRSVELTVLGRLPSLGAFSPDERSSYEWWLIESDAEHRVSVKTDARQVDSTESPIARTLPSARLYLATKGTRLDASVQQLASMEALAVVVSSQARTIVWTREGDFVAQDDLTYDNNGVDYLPFDTGGKPIYLEIDGEPQKILADEKAKKGAILVPLRKGKHSVRIQSLAKADAGILGGSLAVPSAAHTLPISRARVTLGMPARIIPLWFSGGEGVESPVGWSDAIFAAAGVLLALLLFSGARARTAGAAALVGLWFAAPPLFVALLVVAVAVALVVLVVRRLQGWKRWLTLAATCVAVGIGALVVILAAVTLQRGAAPLSSDVQTEYDRFSTLSTKNEADDSMGQRALPAQQKWAGKEDLLGNAFYQGLAAVQGVTPVALPMPGYEKAVATSRQLVTKERPLAPVLVYATSAALWPLAALWLLAIAWLAFETRERIRAALRWTRRLWRRPGAADDDEAEIETGDSR